MPFGKNPTINKIMEREPQEEEKIILERAEVGDINKILEIEKDITGTKLYHGLTGSEDREKDFLDNTFYLIKKDGRVVGNVAYSMKDKDRAYIRWLGIAKEFQEQGIARKALQTLIEQLKGVEIIELVTHPENTKAIALYRSLGFKQIGEQMENYFGDGEPKIKMILEKEQSDQKN